jgi:hypothetical protein
LRGRISIALALLALSGLTACGQGDTDKSAHQTTVKSQPPVAANRKKPVSKTRYLRKANAVCRQLLANTTELRRRYLFKPSTIVRQRGLAKAAAAVRSPSHVSPG